jgi:tetratricopeptide (TPR) repeat protein
MNRKNVKNAEKYVRKEISLARSGQPKQALKAFDEALKLKPDDASVWYTKGILLDELGHHDEAIRAFDEALKYKPNFASAYNAKGLAYAGLNRREEALKSFEEALQHAPDYASAWYNKGNVLGDLGRNHDAVNAFAEALKHEPNNASAWNNRGIALGDLGHCEEALRAFEGAIKCEPCHTNAWHNMGNLLSHLGRYEEALKAFDKASKYGAKSITIVFEDKYELYKISEITLSSDGSFSLSVPYCRERTGSIYMTYVDLSPHYFKLDAKQMIKSFAVDRSVKVTMHTSGFVQFSGKGVISGIDRTTGDIKGVGLISSPLEKPIESGPTIGGMMWGLSSGYTKYAKDAKHPIIFREGDYYYRFASPDNYNCYLLEIFVFPGMMRRQIKEDKFGYYMYNQFFQYREQPGAIFKLRVIYLKNISSFLGILVTRSFSQFGEGPHGYQLGTASGPEEYIHGKPMRRWACALYPPVLSMEGMQSIRYEPSDDKNSVGYM